jgi:hypothetical protein
MNRADVASICHSIYRFEKLRGSWDKKFPQNKQQILVNNLGPMDHAEFYGVIHDFRQAITDLGFRNVERRLRRVEALRNSTTVTNVEEMCTEIRILSEQTLDELKDQVFIHIPADKLTFAGDPKELFGTGWAAYPSARLPQQCSTRWASCKEAWRRWQGT